MVVRGTIANLGLLKKGAVELEAHLNDPNDTLQTLPLLSDCLEGDDEVDGGGLQSVASIGDVVVHEADSELFRGNDVSPIRVRLTIGWQGQRAA